MTGSTIVIVGLIDISIQRQQKRGCEIQLIHRRLSRTKSIGSGSDPESGRQTVRRYGLSGHILRDFK